MTEDNRDHTPIVTAASKWRRFLAYFSHAPEPSSAHRLYSASVSHARYPLYYEHLGVPDTPEGRFEVLALHVGLVVRRLVQDDPRGQKTAQSLVDLMMADMDGNLRELGIGDLSVGKQVKRLASQFNARVDVLKKAFNTGDHELLRPMLATNAYHGITSPPADKVTGLLRACEVVERSLAGQDVGDLAEGIIQLPDERVVREACLLT